MKRVVLETPYAGRSRFPPLRWLQCRRNVSYARRALRDCLDRGEAPIASHLLMTQVLDDNIPAERTLGLEAGLAWMPQAELVVFYVDRGMSRGMKAALETAERLGVPVEMRNL